MPGDRAAADYSGCNHAGIVPKPNAKAAPKPNAKASRDAGSEPKTTAPPPTAPQPNNTDDGEPILQFKTLDEWERWLAEHHADFSGVWLKIAKKGTEVVTVHYPEVLDIAICHGWIDARRRAHDETFFLQRFAPRGPRSKWSEVNRDKATSLIEEGRMRATGLAQVKAAQADGRWDAAYAPQSRATIPEDFQRALDQHPAASAFFATLTGARRYAFLYRLHHVRTPQRRAERIATYIDTLSQGKTLN